MLPTSARLLRLLSLLQTRRYWSGDELGQRLEVDVRTVRRDVDRLRELGYPVRASSGVGGGYQLGAGADLPPVLLDDEEAVAVAVALRAAAGSVGRIEETAMRLLAKLDQLLPARLRRRASALHAVTLSLGTTESLPDAEVLTRTAAACRDRQCLRFGYRDHGGKASERVVEPLRLVNFGRRWYLVGWDRRRGDWRTFRLDRVRPPVAIGERFAAREPPQQDLAAYVSRAISYAPFQYQAKLRLRGSASAVAEQVPAWCGVLEAVDERSCILSTGADSIEALVAQIAVAGVDFELIEPLDLAPALQRVVERLRTGLAAA